LAQLEQRYGGVGLPPGQRLLVLLLGIGGRLLVHLGDERRGPPLAVRLELREQHDELFVVAGQKEVGQYTEVVRIGGSSGRPIISRGTFRAWPGME
jgi:hypothetical protein